MSDRLVVITSKAHIPRMHAPQVLMDNRYSNWKLVVDDDQQAERAQHAGHIPPSHIVVTGKPDDLPAQDGIAWTRQWIEMHLVKPNEWYVSLDDNVRGWTRLPEPYYSRQRIDFDIDMPMGTRTWRELYELECPFDQVVEAWDELVAECEANQTLAGGMAVETNYYFRGNKWQRYGYVRAQNAVWKNTGLPFYYWRGAMLEDFIRTVDVVAQCGSVAINRYIKPMKTFFEAGGIGTFEERKPNLIECSNELLRRYPGLVRRNKGQEYQLTFAVRSLKGVEKWRAKQASSQA